MYKFKINQININSINGIQEIVPKRINIIVGPNNSGKSRLLKELRDYLAGDHRDLKILSTFAFPYPDSFDEINTAYNIGSKMVQDQYGNWMLKVYTNRPDQTLDRQLRCFGCRSNRNSNGNCGCNFRWIIAEFSPTKL